MDKIENIRKTLKIKGLDGFITNSYYNRMYLSGFTRSKGILLITTKEKYLIVDEKYMLQAIDECSDFIIVKRDREIDKILKEICEKDEVFTLGFEEEFLVYKDYIELLNDNITNLSPTSNIVESMRCTKNRDEIKAIEKACDIGDRAFSEIVKYIRENDDLTEADIERALEYKIREYGGESSFSIIVVSGKRCAMPHGRPTNKKIEKGDLITIDFGVLVNGYRSDMTRTVAKGKPSEELIKIYNIVKKAQHLGITKFKLGMTAESLDLVVREYIKEKGFFENFVHGTGHGIGLEGHECIKIDRKRMETLENNYTFTIEPGIYIENLGGVRIEDTVVIENGKIRVLTKSTKELMVL